MKSVSLENSENFILNNLQGDSSFSEIYGDITFADFTFNVDNKEFKVHRLVLAKKSEVFKNFFLADIKSRECVINHIKPEVFELLIKFIYKPELPNITDEKYLDLYEAAHDYKVTDLENYCKHKAILHYGTMLNVQNALDILKTATKYSFEDLIADCWFIIK